MLLLNQRRHSYSPGLGEADLTLSTTGQEDACEKQEKRQQLPGEVRVL